MQAHPERSPRGRWPLRVLGALLVGLLLCSCGALALIPLFAQRASHETQADRAFQVLFAALFTLLGALLLFTERQLRQRGWSRAPISLVRLLFTSRASFTFWMGLALFGVALARLRLSTQADALNVAFWAIAAFWLIGEAVMIARVFLWPRRARAPGRDAEPGV